MADTVLACLKRGEQGIVTALPQGSDNLRKLLVFGVLPGIRLQVLQDFPGIVFAVGNTVLALDKDIARDIKVRRIAAKGL